ATKGTKFVLFVAISKEHIERDGQRLSSFDEVEKLRRYSLEHGQPPMRRPIITPLGNRIATEASAMARIPLTIDHIKTGKYVLNIESVGLTQDQLCSLSDILNEVQFKLQFKLDEYVANGAKFGFLIYPPQRNVYVYRPGHIPQRLDNIQSV